MRKYNVTGMSCAACQARVEKAVNSVEGVTSCAVSLLTNSMGVEGDASDEAIITAVVAAGYGASSADASTNSGSSDDVEDSLKDTETPRLRRRLLASLGFLIVLMYFSMGHMMFGWPLPHFFKDNHVAMGLLQMILAMIIMLINQKFFVNGFKGLLHGSPNMDTLVALGSGASFLWSTVVLFLMTDCQVKGDSDGVMRLMDEFYFESAAMILTLITVGKMLEARSKGKTTDALKGLMKLAAKKANILVDGVETEVDIKQVKIGDVFVVRPGESIPVDGEIIEGNTAVNESTLTGESIPVDKSAGDSVSAATINTAGFITCRATRVGEDTTLSQIIKMVSDAAATKAPIAKIADRVSGIFVPTVIGISIVTMIIWLLVGAQLGYAFARGIAVLVISCPCALGLATPVAIMVGNGVGAKHGIMFKNAEALEQAGKMNIVALDKTGTITEGKPKVTDIYVSDGVNEKEIVSLAYALEKKSEHPLSKAIIEYALENNIDENAEVEDFKALPGNGLCAKLNGSLLYGGNQRYILKYAEIPKKLLQEAEEVSRKGKTPLFFAKNNICLGFIAVSDTIKADSRAAIEEMRQLGITVVMITGDNENSARAIGELAGVDNVIAGVLPDEKAKVISKLKEHGKTIMVGDGINDAPALTTADLGVAIGAGTDIAIDAADVVLMKSSLSDVPAAIKLSKKTLRNIKENLFWAFFYNCLGIPLAAGAYVKLFGWSLNPMFGAAAMSLSSFCVVTNALRINFVNIYSKKVDRKYKKIKKNGGITLDLSEIFSKESTMTKTMNIQGMMCGHCEATVKKALEALEGVSEAVVSHDAGTAVLTLTADVDNELLKKTVEDKDFTVIDIK